MITKFVHFNILNLFLIILPPLPMCTVQSQARCGSEQLQYYHTFPKIEIALLVEFKKVLKNKVHTLSFNTFTAIYIQLL